MSGVEARLTSERGFYIGDICYVLDDETYYGCWGKAKVRKEDGTWDITSTSEDGYQNGTFRVGELEVAVSSTKYGDGCYSDDNGRYRFPVDAGVIGVVPLELVKDIEEAYECGAVLKGTTAHFYEEDGVFEIRIRGGSEYHSLRINTGCEEDEEDDEEEEW